MSQRGENNSSSDLRTGLDGRALTGQLKLFALCSQPFAEAGMTWFTLSHAALSCGENSRLFLGLISDWYRLCRHLVGPKGSPLIVSARTGELG